jgi:hypothetical protein
MQSIWCFHATAWLQDFHGRANFPVFGTIREYRRPEEQFDCLGGFGCFVRSFLKAMAAP